MKWKIYNSNEPLHWHETLNRITKTDIYYLPEYHRAYEKNGDGSALVFIATEKDKILFYPFFIRKIDKVGSRSINETWFDIETVYGYSGPLCNTDDKNMLSRGWKAFSNWCLNNNIVAEFIRFNPFIENHKYLDDSAKVIFERNTIVVNLNCNEEELWKNYSSGHRTKVRKAINNGLVCTDVSVEDGIDTFYKMYYTTMDRVAAKKYYYFSKNYFDSIEKELDQHSRIFIVNDKKQNIAAALFFIYNGIIHYHLGGSLDISREHRPNNLLFHTVAVWGQKKGMNWLHLGGGNTSNINDSLFRFKKSISKKYLKYYIGKRIHNADIYRKLCEEWKHQNKNRDFDNIFLLYRLPIKN